jgi:hypothetical protein
VRHLAARDAHARDGQRVGSCPNHDHNAYPGARKTARETVARETGNAHAAGDYQDSDHRNAHEPHSDTTDGCSRFARCTSDHEPHGDATNACYGSAHGDATDACYGSAHGNDDHWDVRRPRAATDSGERACNTYIRDHGSGSGGSTAHSRGRHYGDHYFGHGGRCGCHGCSGGGGNDQLIALV